MPTIVPKDAADRERLRVALLEAAGDFPERVQYDTSGPSLAFDVDDDLVAAISGDATDAADDDQHTDDDGDTVPDWSAFDPPARNGSTEDWAEFMATVPNYTVPEEPKRDQLIDDWDRLSTDTE